MWGAAASEASLVSAVSALGARYRGAVDEAVAASLGLAGALLAGYPTAVLLGGGGMRRSFDVWSGFGLLNELESGCLVIDTDPTSRALCGTAQLPQLEVASVDELEPLARIGLALSQRMQMPIGLRVAAELLGQAVTEGDALGTTSPVAARYVREGGPIAGGAVGGRFHVENRHRRWVDLARWSEILVEDLGREGKKAVIVAGDLPRSVMARAWSRRMPVLRVAMTVPLPDERVIAFLRSREEVLVLERGDAILTRAVMLLCHEHGLACRVVRAEQTAALDDEQIDLQLGRFGGRVRAEADPPAREADRWSTILQSVSAIAEDEREPWALYLARRRKGAARLGAAASDGRRRLLDALRGGGRATTITAADSGVVELALADRLVDVVAPAGTAAAVAGGLGTGLQGESPPPLAVALLDEHALYSGELGGIVDNVLGQREILHVLLVARAGKNGGLSDEQLEGLLRSTGLKVASVGLDDDDLAGAVAYAMSRTGARALLCFAR